MSNHNKQQFDRVKFITQQNWIIHVDYNENIYSISSLIRSQFLQVLNRTLFSSYSADFPEMLYVSGNNSLSAVGLYLHRELSHVYFRKVG
jgi:hypothetical protein